MRLKLSATILGVAPQLANSPIDSWFGFGVSIEIALFSVMLIFGIIELIAAIGLWTGKKFSYYLSLAVPIGAILFNLALLSLFTAASPTVNSDTMTSSYVGVGVGILWRIIFCWYLRKDHVKAYLKIQKG
jgi:hypothetical protein